jgi:hypothetical protein
VRYFTNATAGEGPTRDGSGTVEIFITTSGSAEVPLLQLVTSCGKPSLVSTHYGHGRAKAKVTWSPMSKVGRSQSGEAPSPI